MAGTIGGIGTHVKTKAELRQLAIWAFDRYKLSVGGKAWDGTEIGTFDHMDGRVQQAWEDVVDEVLKRQDETLYRDTGVKRF